MSEKSIHVTSDPKIFNNSYLKKNCSCQRLYTYICVYIYVCMYSQHIVLTTYMYKICHMYMPLINIISAVIFFILGYMNSLVRVTEIKIDVFSKAQSKLE